MSTPAPKLSLSQLTLHNPSRMKDAEIIATFAVRQRLLDHILADIAAEKPRSRALHHLIIGRRGMGKSTLLARIAAELRTDAYSCRFIPLVFAEEQYSVDRLSKFWLNCLDSLADAHERNGDKAAADAIDATIRSLPPAPASQEESAAKASLEAFLKAAESTARRPVLLVDNLQLVFERLPKAQQHVLRELLMRPGCPILIGASPSALPESQDYGAPFYDQFKVRYLERLSEEEMRQLMLHLAQVFDRPDVRDRVLADPRRITVLRQLTGGNPRTTVTLFFLYAEDFAPGVFGDLQNLLDRVTPLYKALFEELSVQQQVIASAIANRWDPVTARQLSEDTGLPITGISPQLDRLERTGFIEKVSLQGQSATGFLITERFFNVWFLMRNASRRRRQEVEYLTRFLEMYLENPERHRLAMELQERQRLSDEEHFITRALLPTLDSNTADDLERKAELDALAQKAAAARRRLEEVFDFGLIHPASWAFDELRKKLTSLVPAEAQIRPEEFANEVLGDRRAMVRGTRHFIATAQEKLTMEQLDVARHSAQFGKAMDEQLYSKDAAQWLCDRLATGQIRALNDAADWSRAFLQAPAEYDYFALMADTVVPETGKRLSTPALEKLYSVLEPSKSASPGAWRQWGDTLMDHLGFVREARTAYQIALELDPKHVDAWLRLGDLSLWHEKRPEEAEVAYQNACKHAKGDNRPYLRLGLLFLDQPGRQEDAWRAYNRVISTGELNAMALFGLAILVRDHVGDLDAAQRYLEAIQHQNAKFGGSGVVEINLGILSACQSNWGLACTAFNKAFDKQAQGIPPEGMNEWIRASAVLLHLGYGTPFLDFLDTLQSKTRLRPWYEALSALHTGDRLLLQNLAPEVRETAEKLYDEIDRRLQMLPEKTRRRPLPAAATKKRKK
jgi:tetratricopeptide (TPR) repeat protein